MEWSDHAVDDDVPTLGTYEEQSVPSLRDTKVFCLQYANIYGVTDARKICECTLKNFVAIVNYVSDVLDDDMIGA